MSSMSAPDAASSPPNVAASMMAKMTKAPSTTALLRMHTLETEERKALSKQRHVDKLTVAQIPRT